MSPANAPAPHVPVLLAEVVSGLAVAPGEKLYPAVCQIFRLRLSHDPRPGGIGLCLEILELLREVQLPQQECERRPHVFRFLQLALRRLAVCRSRRRLDSGERPGHRRSTSDLARDPPADHARDRRCAHLTVDPGQQPAERGQVRNMRIGRALGNRDSVPGP